ncbi:MAG: hypothetical protein ACE5GX_00385 [Thermoanaerobaculia bacterium]
MTAAVLAVALWAGAVAPAQATVRGFRLGRWTGFAELGFDHQEQNLFSSAGSRPLVERNQTEQRFGFRNTAIFVSRRFLTVNFGLTLGFLRSSTTSGLDQEASGEGKVRGYDLNATFMPDKAYGFTLFANQAETVTPVEFAGSQRLDTSSLGLAFQVGPRFFPARLSYRNNTLESISDFDRQIRAFDQKKETLSYQAENRWRRNEAYLFLQIEDVEDELSPRFSNQTQTASLNHTIELLEPRLATLRSTVRYFDRSGELTSSSFSIDEDLRLRHRDTLESGLRYEYRNQETFSGRATDSQRLSAWLNHRLWESLDTDLRFTRSDLTSDAGRSSQDQARLQFDYRKRLPGRGKLTGRLGSTYDRRDSLDGDGELLISREQQRLRFGVPSRLDQPAVIPGTVVVTDELGSTIFEEGTDYEIHFVGEFAEILPLPGGRIADGQSILVEYRIRVPDESRFDSRRTELDVSVDYSWITGFFGFRSFSDDLLAGQTDSLLDDRRDKYAGFRLRRDGQRIKLSSFNELRTRDSSLLAFESLRLADGLTYIPSSRWTIRANLVWMDTRFKRPVRETEVMEGRVSAQWEPVPSLKLESYASHREVVDSLAADQAFERFGFSARWRLGKVQLIASAEHWQRERGFQTVEGVTGSLRFSRRFFPGTLPARRRAPEYEPWPEDLPGMEPYPYGAEAAWEQDEPGITETSGLFDLAEHAAGRGEQNPAEPSGSGEPETQAPTQPAESTSGQVEAPRDGKREQTTVPDRSQEERAIRSVVEGWAAAWAAGDVDRYLSSYSAEFRPASGAKRDAWQRLRRQRLLAPAWIEVDIESLSITESSRDRVRVSFCQAYRSSLCSDSVDKTLELVREGSEWKILEENAHGMCRFGLEKRIERP